MSDRERTLLRRFRQRAGRLPRRVACWLVPGGGSADPTIQTPDPRGGASRRQLLGSLGLLPILGAFGLARPDPKKETDPLSLPDAVDRPAQLEHQRLRILDLQSPEAAGKQKPMPTGKIAGVSLGRLISGSNLISLNMHARDLHYVHDLAQAYNTQERVFMTLKKCEELGCNSIVLKDHNFRRFQLSKYWTDWGGQMTWLADVITKDINDYERRLVQHLELGAWSAYLWGGASDIWYHQGHQDYIIKAYEIMRKYDIPVGIGAHRLEPIAFCEREGLKPDYYIKTLHHDRYWSAHPEGTRRFIEMFEPNSPNHDEYHDNMFCHDAQETVEFMQDVKVPWIAFKVLAAGAIPPKEGIQYAFDSGADFICLGMFDFQIEEDAKLIRDCAAKAKNRKRPWA